VNDDVAKRWKPDHEILQSLVAAGFTEIVLPFETGSMRIMRKYASNKLNIEKNDIGGLIAACKDYGLRITGNYMLGYPDETLPEIESTIQLARNHMAFGLDAANFFLVMPLPGTPLYEMACEQGHIDPDFDPDTMNWTRANMTNTAVPAGPRRASGWIRWQQPASTHGDRLHRRRRVAARPVLVDGAVWKWLTFHRGRRTVPQAAAARGTCPRIRRHQDEGAGHELGDHRVRRFHRQPSSRSTAARRVRTHQGMGPAHSEDRRPSGQPAAEAVPTRHQRGGEGRRSP
jgi:hypothetical protein